MTQPPEPAVEVYDPHADDALEALAALQKRRRRIARLAGRFMTGALLALVFAAGVLATLIANGEL